MRRLRGIGRRLAGRVSPARGPRVLYKPSLDGRPDPGEIVWMWVPYEDRPDEGKDRPVLVVGREKKVLLGLYLSSNPARNGQPGWLPLGRGAWDRQGRQSFLRVDRVVRLTEHGIRREASVLDQRRFDAVAAVLRSEYGWR